MDLMWKSGVEFGGVFVLPHPEQSSKSDQTQDHDGQQSTR